MANKEKNNSATGTLFGQKNKDNRFCYCCGKKNHTAVECSKRDNISHNQWAINQEQQLLQQAVQDDNSNNDLTVSTNQSGMWDDGSTRNV